MKVVASGMCVPSLGLGVVLALLLGWSFGLGGLDEAEVSAVLVVKAPRHSAAQLQPVLLELPHACPFLLPGRAVCPALGPGGRWTPWHAERPPGASGGANEVGPTRSGCRPWPVRCRVGWRRLRLGVGHASTVRPDPSTLGVAGERGSHHEGRSPARSRPLVMSPAPPKSMF